MSHLGGAIHDGDGNTIMPDVWGYLLVRYEIKSVLDIGCGTGHTLKWFSGFLCNVTGIEGDPECVAKAVIPKERMILFDFTKGAPGINVPHDLAWSAEFLEHLEEKYLENVMPSFRLCRYAVITHAEPGQGGFHHVNCRTTKYWIDQFGKHGFRYVDDETQRLRRTDHWRANWGRRTLTFFEQE